jgi:hypothetical protein
MSDEATETLDIRRRAEAARAAGMVPMGAISVLPVNKVADRMSPENMVAASCVGMSALPAGLFERLARDFIGMSRADRIDVLYRVGANMRADEEEDGEVFHDAADLAMAFFASSVDPASAASAGMPPFPAVRLLLPEKQAEGVSKAASVNVPDDLHAPLHLDEMAMTARQFTETAIAMTEKAAGEKMGFRPM